jgi:aspartate racemase
MQTIGLLGGMSWESTALYYRIVNETVRDLLGGHHSARMVIVSVDFAEIEAMQHADRWEEAGERLAVAARTLERAGADFLVMATNTMHVVADRIAATIAIPILHIADPTVEEIRARGLVRVGLMATRFTMERDF